MKPFDRTMAVLLLIALAAFIIVLNSCTLRVEPDGTRVWGSDPAAAAKAIEILYYAK
jgi:hypothetical protein